MVLCCSGAGGGVSWVTLTTKLNLVFIGAIALCNQRRRLGPQCRHFLFFSIRALYNERQARQKRFQSWTLNETLGCHHVQRSSLPQTRAHRPKSSLQLPFLWISHWYLRLWLVGEFQQVPDQKKFSHFLTTAGLETSCRRETSITQHAQVFCLVLSRRRIGAGLRRLSDRAPRSAQCHHVCTTQVGVAHAFG